MSGVLATMARALTSHIVSRTRKLRTGGAEGGRTEPARILCCSRVVPCEMPSSFVGLVGLTDLIREHHWTSNVGVRRGGCCIVMVVVVLVGGVLCMLIRLEREYCAHEFWLS